MGPPPKDFIAQIGPGTKVRPLPQWAPHFYRWRGQPGASKVMLTGTDLYPGQEAIITGPPVIAGAGSDTTLRDELLGPTDRGWLALWSGSLGKPWVEVVREAPAKVDEKPMSIRQLMQSASEDRLNGSPARPPRKESSRGEPVVAMDLVEGVLCGLSAVSASRRGEECSKRRNKIRSAIAQVQRVLEESDEAIKLRPSKTDKLTAGSYHTCFRHLHWVLDRSRQMQEVAEILEDYDTERFSNQTVALDYALLSVDIVAQHEYATDLLERLCNLDSGPSSIYRPGNSQSKLPEWMQTVVKSCSSRVCIREPQPLPQNNNNNDEGIAA